MAEPRHLIAAAAALAAVTGSAPSHAFERQWHVGATVGYSMAAFPNAVASGFGAAGYGTYGINDAINLRAQFDFTIVDIPEPGTSALIYMPALGAEYVFDTLQWILYVGLLAGPVNVSIQDGPDLWQAGLAIPLGLNYQLSRSFAIGVEGQYRLYLFGAEGSPVNNLWAGGRFEYTWGY
jgi:opacity protein-like surface antigen